MNDAEKLVVAKGILVNVLCAYGAEGRHTEACAAGSFYKHHKNHPGNHPIWSVAPACNCVIGQIAKFLETN